MGCKVYLMVSRVYGTRSPALGCTSAGGSSTPTDTASGRLCRLSATGICAACCSLGQQRGRDRSPEPACVSVQRAAGSSRPERLLEQQEAGAAQKQQLHRMRKQLLAGQGCSPSATKSLAGLQAHKLTLQVNENSLGGL